MLRDRITGVETLVDINLRPLFIFFNEQLRRVLVYVVLQHSPLHIGSALLVYSLQIKVGIFVWAAQLF